MRVITLPTYGSADVLREADRPEPEPTAGTARVAVAASTLNPVDLETRSGDYRSYVPDLALPAVLGWDLAGTLLDAVDGLAAGQRVAAMVPWFAAGGAGTNAEVVLAERDWLAPLPDELDLVTAATLPLNGLTAVQTLDLLGLQPGQTVFVDRASGGVGSFVVQLAAGLGARVIAVAADDADAAYVAGLGAEQVVVRGDAAALVAAARRFAPDGVDAAMDVSAGDALLGAVRDGGTFVTITGAAPAPERGIDVKRQGVEPDRAQLEGVIAAHLAGGLDTRIADTMPLSATAEAHRRLEAGGVRGKIVLTT
jgi:NADPH:quinone reductase